MIPIVVGKNEGKAGTGGGGGLYLFIGLLFWKYSCVQ